MTFELWKESKVIVAGVLSLIINHCPGGVQENQVTRRSPIVSYAVPWIKSTIDLGRDPGAFLEHAMYVEQFFTRLEAGDNLLFNAKYGDIFTVKVFERIVTRATPPQVGEIGVILS